MPHNRSNSLSRKGRRWMRPALCALAIGGTALTVAASAEAAPQEHVVTMANMSFGTLPSDIKVGDTIIWVNRDTVPHTATARDKSFDVRVAAGKRARMTVKKAGRIPIYCIYHPAMRASLGVAAR